jgi:RNA polymerase sigma factor (TIGR02999 family)
VLGETDLRWGQGIVSKVQLLNARRSRRTASRWRVAGVDQHARTSNSACGAEPTWPRFDAGDGQRVMLPCRMLLCRMLLRIAYAQLRMSRLSCQKNQMPGEGAVRDIPRGEITRQLLAWSTGDESSMRMAFSALHDELRRLAERALSGERANHTLEPSGLVSEAFFRMLDQQRIEWQSREHFTATAAQMMRRILVDYSRAHSAAKRGHGAPALPLDAAALMPSDSMDELVAIHDALEALAVVDRSQSEIVALRFFGGMTHEEIASYLGVSLPTVERRWRLARAWLYRKLRATT